MVGLIEPSLRSSGEHRLFDRHTLKQIRMVKLLNASGYSLREVREIFLEKKESLKSKVQGPKPKSLKSPKISRLKKTK